MSRLLFAAGGTGGHVFPALAIANAARKLNAEAQILFVGTAKGFESRLVPQAGYRLELIQVEGIKGKGITSRLKSLMLLPKAFWQSRKILKTFSPTAVFGIGGYASGPILFLASLGKAHTAVLEPNSIPGFSNRVLGRVVDRIFVAFDEAKKRLPAAKCVFSGNPIREDILAVPPPTFAVPKRTVLVFGGSQGAKKLNDAMIDALKPLELLKGRFRVIHQTGEKDFERVRDAYKQAGFEAEVHKFIDNMAEAYRVADIVVARSGSSVLEIAACGLPSILVPFPHAADDHQEANARVLEKAGAAFHVSDANCSGAVLSSALQAVIENQEKLKAMSQAALSLRKADAAATIARDLMEGRA
jgi:UDP-N-acetylglucosamine--N-acetylmuramyl-(pentapeptide) pyrophosphoryl-undecaprenol N-acetylglucosamine transferase